MNIAILNGKYITTRQLEEERKEVARINFEQDHGWIKKWVLFPIQQLGQHRVAQAIAQGFKARFKR